MKPNLTELEELAKNATPSPWYPDGTIEDYWNYLSESPEQREIITGKIFANPQEDGEEMQEVLLDESENMDFVLALVNAFPSILQTIRAYEEAIEHFRDIKSGCSLEKEHDSILSNLDKKLSEIE